MKTLDNSNLVSSLNNLVNSVGENYGSIVPANSTKKVFVNVDFPYDYILL